MTQMNLFDRKTADKKRDERKVKWAKEQKVAKANLSVARQILAVKRDRVIRMLTITSLEG